MKIVNRMMQCVLKNNNPERFMKIAFLRRNGGLAKPGSRWFGAIAMAVLCLAEVNLFAGATVNWVSGGPNYGYPSGAGYVDGNITTDAEYHTPSGLAVDITGNYLFVADRDNNAVRVLEFDINYAGTLLTMTNYVPVTSSFLFSKPVGVALDSSYNTFVLNYANGANGYVLQFDGEGELVATNISNLTNAAGIALDTSDNIYLTASNTVFKITPAGVSSVVATITAPGASLQGIIVKRSGPTAGFLAVCDSGRNGILLINPNTGVVTTNAGFHGAGDFITVNNSSPSNTAKFFQPTGIAESGDGTLIVTDYGNHRVKAVLASGTVTNLYGVTSNDWVNFSTPPWQFPGFVDGTVAIPDQLGGVAARQPNGVAMAPDGTIYVTEDYYHIIREIAKGTTGLLPPPPPSPTTPTGPAALAGYGQVMLTWTASPGATNYNIKRSTTSGGETTIASTTGVTYTDATNVLDGTTYYYIVSALNTGGESENSTEVSATPLFSPAPTNLTITATNFGLVSLSWAPSAGATSYNVKRSTSTQKETTIANVTSPTYSDTSVINGETYFYVVSAVNPGGENPTNSAEASATVPIPPPPAPTIGWFDYEFNGSIFVTVFHPVSGTPYIANNDLTLAIEPNIDGASTYFTDDGSLPGPTNGNSKTPPVYFNGTPNYQIPMSVAPASDLKIKAVNLNSGGSSPVVTAEFVFQVANPSITGNNAAQFTLNDVTTNAQFLYTTDGSDPRTSINATLISPITGTNGLTLSLPFPANTNLMVFQIVAFRANYLTSSVAAVDFSTSNYVPNTISFGFASGEASSVFVASPGQTFFAPVTLLPLSGVTIYSMDFNLTVTNAGLNPGPAITPGAFVFTSMLRKPDPANPGYYLQIPPYMFINTNSTQITNTVFYDGSTNFVSLLVTNLSENLLGVGWLERATKTNLYDTTAQDLIKYSQAHDTLFLEANGRVVLGGYSFQVPAGATNNQTYQIQIGRPSATSDGVGAPGSSVFILAPTNGSLAGGAINSIKNVTVGQLKYIVGDAYPFHWFNAGDFGNTNLENADIQQVFNSAVYNLNSPVWQAPGSDFADAMDSCGNFGALDTDPASPYNGYYTNANNAPLTAAQQNALFNGDFTTMDQIAFGDGGPLDVCDVYVTYVRKQDPQRTWYRRFWLNGVRVAEKVTNQFISGAVKQSSGGKIQPAFNPNLDPVSITNTPSVNFVGGDFQATAGQTIQIPVTATVFGSYPLRVAMLNISVVPLDGSPALTAPISFTPGVALGQPVMTDSEGPGNYAAAWLNSTIAGISNSGTIGTLNITIPSNATGASAYAVHFDHASGSPNGLASFPKQTFTGLITLSRRANSSYNDGIPDSWRLRWFGTINNLLSVSNACPSGDGINNWMKYVAGVNPNTPNNFPSLNPNATPPSGAAMSIYWPTVSGKQYVILSSASLFPGNWTTNTIITGNGANMEFDDNSSGAVKFYRVLILP
jgi:hypothetical protein